MWFGTTSSKPPYWFVGGEKYIISIDSTNDSVDVRFQIKRTSNTSLQSLAIYSQSGKYILDVPEDITVLRVVSMVNSGITLNNDTLTLNIERVLNVKSEISELRSGLGVLGIKNDLTWNNGSYKTDGTISTTVQYGNRYCNIIDATTFKKLTITPFLGRQVCLAFFDRTTGAFVSRSDYTTESVTIDNTYSVGINLATTYTDRTISTEDLLSLVEIYRSIPLSKWTGRKVAFVGDSITHGSYAPIPYHAVLNNIIGFSDMYVDGVAGSAYSVTATGNYTPISQRWQNIPTDRDLVVIFAGTNDWGHDAPIGTPADTTDVSMCGALSVVINGILTSNPSARLVLITPLHRWGYAGGNYPNDTDNNGQGHPLADYVDAIKDMAQAYSIPVIDLFSDSGLNPRIPAISTAFFQDGLHPINAGHARMARQIASELEVLNFSGSGIKADLEVKYNQLSADIDTVKADLGDVKDLTVVTDEAVVTTDVLNTLTWTSGYMGTSGATGTSSTLRYSNKMSVSKGDVLDVLPTTTSFRFVCAFNGDTPVSTSGAQNVNTYTVPDGIDGVVLTVYSPESSYRPTSINYTTKNYTSKNIYKDDIAELTTNVNAIGEAVTVGQYQNEIETDIIPTFSNGYINTNGVVNETGSASYFDHTQKIPVQAGDVVSAWKDGNSYDMRFVCAFSGDNVVSASGWDNSGSVRAPYVVPEGIDGVAVSVRDSYGINAIKVIHRELAKSAYVKPTPLGYMMEHGSLTNGEVLSLPYHNVKNDNIYVFNANIDTFEQVKFIKSSDFYIEVDSTNLYITNDTTTYTAPHGINIADNITLMVCNETAESVSLIRVSSDGQEFNYTTATRFLMDTGAPQIQSVGSTLTECTFSWVSKNVNAPIWLFGDSYFSWYNNRWTYYLARDGYTKDCLLNGYAGEASKDAYDALINLLGITTPKIVVWCMGMNDGDSTTAVNANWEKYYNRLINLSKKYGFEIVLYTVPTTPVINNKFKNAIARDSGYRYIEADLAVRIDDNGNWITGALNEGTTESPDNVHPTPMGAKIIYYRVISDLPEIMCNT